MRCPKCGYISFDDRAACSKCSHSLEELLEELRGTGIHTDIPNFLAATLAEPDEEETPEIELEGEEPALEPEAESEGEIAFAIEDEEDEAVTALAGIEEEGKVEGIEEEEEGIAFSFKQEEEVGVEPPAPAPESAPVLEETAEDGPDGVDLALEPETPQEEENQEQEAVAATAEDPLPDLELDLGLEEPEEEGMATAEAEEPGEDLDALVDAAQEVEDHSPETTELPAEEPLPELVLDLPEQGKRAEEEETPPPAVGEPAPLRDTSDVTAGLEEIDLADLVDSTAPEGAAVTDEEGEIDIDALEEELFDLADVLEEEEESV